MLVESQGPHDDRRGAGRKGRGWKGQCIGCRWVEDGADTEEDLAVLQGSIDRREADHCQLTRLGGFGRPFFYSSLSSLALLYRSTLLTLSLYHSIPDPDPQTHSHSHTQKIRRRETPTTRRPDDPKNKALQVKRYASY